MDRLFAKGTVNAAQSGGGPPLFLLHSLLSDRARFDAIVPELAKSFSVIVPELPRFGRSPRGVPAHRSASVSRRLRCAGQPRSAARTRAREGAGAGTGRRT